MIKTVIFDLDGTLLNTLEDLTDSVNHVLAQHSMKLRSIDEIRSFVGNGIPMLIKRAVGENASREEYEECLEQMKVWYKEHSQIKTAPYDGVTRLLKSLREMNIATAVVTNKEQTAAEALCEKMFCSLVDAVIGDDGKTPLKPAPDNVFRAMEKLGAHRETTIYVGDSDVDMLTAKNACLESVGVKWGFRDEQTLREGGARHIISSPLELLEILR